MSFCRFSLLLAFLSLCATLLPSTSEAQAAKSESTPRLVFFDVIVAPDLKALQSSATLFTGALGSTLAGLEGIEVLDKGTRDALLLQRKFDLEDCKKAECRFAMARSLPGVDYMLETEVDRISKVCLVTFRLKSVKQGTLVDSFFERTECDEESVFETLSRSSKQVWPPGAKKRAPLKKDSAPDEAPGIADTVRTPREDAWWLWLGAGPTVSVLRGEEAVPPEYARWAPDFEGGDTETLGVDVRVEAGTSWWSAGLSVRYIPWIRSGSDAWGVSLWYPEARFSGNWFLGILRGYAAAGVGPHITWKNLGEETNEETHPMGTLSLGFGIQRYTGLMLEASFGYSPTDIEKQTLYLNLMTGIEPTAFFD